jgi:hypothetical protein
MASAPRNGTDNISIEDDLNRDCSKEGFGKNDTHCGNESIYLQQKNISHPRVKSFECLSSHCYKDGRAKPNFLIKIVNWILKIFRQIHNTFINISALRKLCQIRGGN